MPSGAELRSTCRSTGERARLELPAIDEASGLVASAIHPDVFYTHNDSGDAPRFFAVDRRGAHRGTYSLHPALALDWEDVARGPCSPGKGSCLYFADIGDNLRVRPTGAMYRVPEPGTLVAGEVDLDAEAFPFRYPDGPHDAETLLIHPLTGVLTLVTKVRSGASSIYELPLPLVVNRVATLMRVGEVAPPEGSPRFTAGDVHPKGEGVLLRTYDHVWFYPMTPSQSVADALKATPTALSVASEPQGEAVAWEADGRGYVTVSEGVGSAIDVVRCGPAR
jgi:hypothetical protein